MSKSTTAHPRLQSAQGTQHEAAYHHGDLRAALIRAADEILAQQGVHGFSLREAARRAGVSPAAPTHHFGGSAGLLSEVAALGFIELAERLNVSAPTAAQRLRAQGVAYVRFGVEHTGRFQLMFRKDLLNPDHPALRLAGDRALAQLEATIRQMRAIAPDQPLDAQAHAALMATWSMVHGYAHLLLDGKIGHLNAGASTEELLTQVLPRMLESQWPG